MFARHSTRPVAASIALNSPVAPSRNTRPACHVGVARGPHLRTAYSVGNAIVGSMLSARRVGTR
jgi:hypothetical protein